MTSSWHIVVMTSLWHNRFIGSITSSWCNDIFIKIFYRRTKQWLLSCFFFKKCNNQIHCQSILLVHVHVYTYTILYMYMYMYMYIVYYCNNSEEDETKFIWKGMENYWISSLTNLSPGLHHSFLWITPSAWIMVSSTTWSEFISPLLTFSWHPNYAMHGCYTQ